MRTFIVTYVDCYDNERTTTHSGVRFYIEASGGLLIIGSNDKVEAAYSSKVWRSVI